MMKKIILIFLLLASCADNDNSQQNMSIIRSYIPPEYSTHNPNESRVLQQKLFALKATHEDILEIFKCRDEWSLHNKLNGLVPYVHDIKVVSILEKVWANDKESYPSFSWDLLEKQSSKVLVAFALYQSKVGDRNAYLNYIRSTLKTGDSSSAKYNAAMSLGSLGIDSEIDSMKKLVYEDDMFAVMGAVIGIQLLGTEQSQTVLNELESDKALGEDQRAVVSNSIQNLNGKSAH